jgi:hypothetical protein
MSQPPTTLAKRIFPDRANSLMRLLVLAPQTRSNPLADTFLKPTIVLTSQEPVSEIGIWINHIYGIADKSTLRR